MTNDPLKRLKAELARVGSDAGQAELEAAAKAADKARRDAERELRKAGR
jgi:hypothetical protein